jgi:hypothetical protein
MEVTIMERVYYQRETESRDYAPKMRLPIINSEVQNSKGMLR